MSEILDTVYVVSLKEQLQLIESELTKELINQRPAKMLFGEYNFNVKSKYNPYLYKLFLESSTKLLNKFTLKDENFKTWCSISDNQFDITCWHNHLTTSTINGVIYLKITKEEKGINFLIDNKVQNFIPKQFDLVIFPNYLNHCPLVSKTEEKRISLNLELRCKEKVTDIFDNKENKNDEPKTRLEQMSRLKYDPVID